MSNSQWEVVTKTRKQRNLEKKVNAHTEQKRLESLGPKLEELLPTQQYRNLILGKIGNSNNSNNTSNNHNKDNNNLLNKPKPSPAKSNSSSKSKSPMRKSAAKFKINGVDAFSAKKHNHQTKQQPRPNKAMEQAFRALKPQDFLIKVEELQKTHPGSKLRWLNNLATYFNNALPFECDPLFQGKATYYPSVLVNGLLRFKLLQFLESVGITNLEYFFFTLLDTMATELNNNLPVVGYKFLLQVIAQRWPCICTHNLAKTALLRNSYLNRSNICLSILWAVGQAGYRELCHGVVVWRNVMLPNLEMKPYTKFVVHHLEHIMTESIEQFIDMTHQEFFDAFNVINTPNVRLSKDLQLSLKRSAIMFLKRYICSTHYHGDIFVTLLSELKDPVKDRNELEGLIECLMSGDHCFKVWLKHYKKHTLGTLLLLRGIVDEWENETKTLIHWDEFIYFIRDAASLNQEINMAKNREENNAAALARALRAVHDKSTAQLKKTRHIPEAKEKCGCGKTILASFLVLMLIVLALLYDTEANGKGVFEKSATGKMLKNAGVLPQVQRAWVVTMGTCARVYKFLEKHLPPYLAPTFDLCGDLYKLVRNSLCEMTTSLKTLWLSNWPFIAKFVDEYVPGFSQKLEVFASGTLDVIADIYGKSLSFIQSNVLVGRLSPEFFSKTLNDTQNVALEVYSLFQKKVNAYAKLK